MSASQGPAGTGGRDSSGSEQASPVLDGRFTFDNFVVGSGNRLAYAAAKIVAESPGESYGPLLIHAGSGLGKTHLLGAIGRRVLVDRPELAVRYASLRSLAGELPAGVERGAPGTFRAGLGEFDLLLLDDLQYLSGQAGIQEELLRALDALGSGGGQVVLASDRGPERIEALDERLLSRFRGGLVVDIQSPDHETRAAILRFKIRQGGEELSPDLVDELAARAFSNVRELEGALRELLRGSLPRGGAEGEFAEFLSDVGDTLASVLEAAPAAAAPPELPRTRDASSPRRVPLHGRPAGRAAPGGKVDPFFTDPYKVFLHWEPLADRLVERP